MPYNPFNNPDAYLDETYGEIIGPDDLDALAPDAPVSPLLCVASFDHGMRTADETAYAVGTECVAQVCRAFFVACGIPFDSAPIDWSAVGEDMGWSDVTGWLVNPDDAQALREWCDYDAAAMFTDAGGIVDASGDAGMTWLYIVGPETTARRASTRFLPR